MFNVSIRVVDIVSFVVGPTTRPFTAAVPEMSKHTLLPLFVRSNCLLMVIAPLAMPPKMLTPPNVWDCCSVRLHAMMVSTARVSTLKLDLELRTPEVSLLPPRTSPGTDSYTVYPQSSFAALL